MLGWHRLKAPLGGRVWWESFTFLEILSCFVIVGNLTIDGLIGVLERTLKVDLPFYAPLNYLPLFGEYLRPLGDVYYWRPVLYRGFQAFFLAVAVGGGAVSLAMLNAAHTQSRSTTRGLAVLMAGILMTTASTAYGFALVTYSGLYYQLLLLLSLWATSMVIGAIEFLLHRDPELRAAVNATPPQLPPPTSTSDVLRDVVAALQGS